MYEHLKKVLQNPQQKYTPAIIFRDANFRLPAQLTEEQKQLRQKVELSKKVSKKGSIAATDVETISLAPPAKKPK